LASVVHFYDIIIFCDVTKALLNPLHPNAHAQIEHVATR